MTARRVQRLRLMFSAIAAGSGVLSSPAPAQAHAHAAARTASRLEVSEATIPELQAAMASGRASAVSIVREYLARIAAYDHAGPMINSIIRVNARALNEAAALDVERKAGKVRGPLHGIPVILKDNYDTGDMPTSAGSLALANSRPARDAFVVAQLRKAGAIILAKANMHELAAGITSVSSFGGQTRNPYDPTRCPGGSSGGTGAAIAASFAAVGWGSDTCGSIRIPSAFNSLVGLRPTQGLVSRRGIVPLSHTQDIGGPLARTVTDLAIALDVSVGYDSEDAVTNALTEHGVPHFQAGLDRNAIKGARIGIFLPYFRDTDSEIADTVRAAIAAMKAQGATVFDVPIADFDSLIAGSSANELKFDFIDYMKTVPNAPVTSIRDILDRGLYDRTQERSYRFTDTVSVPDSPDHQKVLAKQAVLRARLERLFDSLSLDALAYPTVRQKPVLVGEVQPGSTCQAAAQSGLPAISMQAGLGADGLPIGIELMGKRFSDPRLVSLAYAFEQAGARRRVPTTTPVLVGGHAPGASAMQVTTQGANVAVTTSVTIDPVRSQLRWSATVTRGATHVTALVLRRRGGLTVSGTPIGATPAAHITAPDSAVRVISRLLGPGMSTASGTLPLSYADRAAYEAGRLSVALYTSDAGAPIEQVVRQAGSR
jgi:Asp-tRNA(Asn)/Glu-tRNA(Gln) amidotransferase A subunit family amidase